MVVVQVPGKVALCDLDLRYSPPSLSLLPPASLSLLFHAKFGKSGRQKVPVSFFFSSLLTLFLEREEEESLPRDRERDRIDSARRSRDARDKGARARSLFTSDGRGKRRTKPACRSRQFTLQLSLSLLQARRIDRTSRLLGSKLVDRR